MRVAFLLAILIAAAFLPLAEAKYTQRLTVQVYDEQFRPVEGAQVYAEYQLSSMFGTGRTKPKLTNASGFADIVFTNYEEIETSTDYTYTLYVRYGNRNASSTMTADPNDDRVRIVDFQIPAYYLFVTVHNQKGAPLSARVTVGDQVKTTDNVGSAGFRLPPGSHVVRAEYLNGLKTDSVELSGDKTLDITIGVYSLKLTITDDDKNPVQASVELDGQEERADRNGKVSFENITNPTPQILIKYGEATKSLPLDLSQQDSATVTFDRQKPNIKEFRAIVSPEGVGTVSLFVEDPGSAASGIESVAISYTVDGAEKSVQAYTVGYNAFEAKIPAQAPGKPVRYSVRVSDKEGNTATQSGTYVIKEAPKPDIPVVNPTTQKKDVFDIGAITPVTAAIYMVAILIVLYGIFYYISKKKPADTAPPSEPGAQPPDVPPA
ncbi:MAG: hypothetical protein QW568_00645 [Candidatus Anstonellaceae archaeon]